MLRFFLAHNDFRKFCWTKIHLQKKDFKKFSFALALHNLHEKRRKKPETLIFFPAISLKHDSLANWILCKQFSDVSFLHYYWKLCQIQTCIFFKSTRIPYILHYNMSCLNKVSWKYFSIKSRNLSIPRLQGHIMQT